jgi:hypothetical protein
MLIGTAELNYNQQHQHRTALSYLAVSSAGKGFIKPCQFAILNVGVNFAFLPSLFIVMGDDKFRSGVDAIKLFFFDKRASLFCLSKTLH